MKKLVVKKGDLFKNLPEQNFIIPHITNDLGIMGSGFVIPLKKMFPKAEKDYVAWHKALGLQLGDTVWTNLGKDRYVANMTAQKGMIGAGNEKPIKYAALTVCMNSVAHAVTASINNGANDIEIIAPKFGSVRAAGNWDFIVELIEEIWLAKDIKTTIYEF